MDFKKEYKTLVGIVKKYRKDHNLPSRNEDIAAILGYHRSYFSTLLGKNGVVGKEHIKSLKLNFKMLDNVNRGTQSNPSPDEDIYPDALRLLSVIGIEVLAHTRYQTKMLAEMWAKANGVPSVKIVHDAERMVADEVKTIRDELKQEAF